MKTLALLFCLLLATPALAADFDATLKLAKEGDAVAQNNLGSIYEQGKGVAQNYLLAHMWFNIAVAQGYEGAAQSRDALAATMDKRDIITAQTLATNCISRNYRSCSIVGYKQNSTWSYFGTLADVYMDADSRYLVIVNDEGGERKLSKRAYGENYLKGIEEKIENLNLIGENIDIKTDQHTGNWDTREWFSDISLVVRQNINADIATWSFPGIILSSFVIFLGTLAANYALWCWQKRKISKQQPADLDMGNRNEN